MKIAAIFFVVLMPMLAATANHPLCMACSTMFTVPTTWDRAQKVFIHGCNALGNAKTPCTNLVNAADLTASYGKMLPHISKLREIGCSKYCR
uniref:Saposin B-type domain-containing protein n=2 Tax=Caenorhabditis japonica TaxID=281687 RepID=A0A8R1EHC5_CAEJA